MITLIWKITNTEYSTDSENFPGLIEKVWWRLNGLKSEDNIIVDSYSICGSLPITRFSGETLPIEFDSVTEEDILGWIFAEDSLLDQAFYESVVEMFLMKKTTKGLPWATDK
tara:strand:- start:682 stop:1017 length:336 start_codon:yes stop_codon:yes gene_type:complete